jgi:hypothetical protein
MPKKTVPPTLDDWRRAQRRCHRAVRRAVRNGLLEDLRVVKEPCSRCCVNRATVWEHRDYGVGNDLSVEPVCRPCNHDRGPAFLTIGDRWYRPVRVGDD